MYESTPRRLRMALFGSLAIIALAGASAAHAAPQDQTPGNSDQAVSIDAFAFAPAEVSIPVGATLAWTNLQDGVRHTTTSPDGVWDSGVLATNDTFRFTFNQAGDFAYQCDIHPTMRGIVHVVSEAANQVSADVTADPPASPSPALSTVLSAPVPQLPAATPTPTALVPAARATATPVPHYGY